MDGDSDMMMHDGSILGTTELNGHVETVDPSAIVFNKEIPSPVATKADLPLLSHHDFAPHSPHADVYSYAELGPPEPTVEVDAESASDSGAESDFMEIIEEPPHHIVQVVIPRPPKVAALPYATSQSGLVYDVRMRFHTEPISSMIDEDDIHPEEPRRILEIFSELVNAGLVPDASKPGLDPETQLLRIDARKATKREICLVHTEAHYEWVKSLKGRSTLLLGLLSMSLTIYQIYRKKSST